MKYNYGDLLKKFDIQVINGHMYEKLHSLLFGDNARFSLINMLPIYRAKFVLSHDSAEGYHSFAVDWVFCADSDEDAATKVRQKMTSVLASGKITVDNPGLQHDMLCTGIECFSLVRNVRDIALYLWDGHIERSGEVTLSH